MLSGLELGGGKVGMIRRVREMLGFEAERVAAVVDFVILSVNTVEKIPSVKLDARLRGQHF